MQKLGDFKTKDSADLNGDEQDILSMIRSNSEKKIGDLYELYRENGGRLVYKSFQRKIDKLERNRFISVKKLIGGKDGNTTIIKYATQTKKLTEF